MSKTRQSTVLVGRNPVREALERGDRRIEKVILQEGARGSAIAQIRSAAKDLSVPVQFVPKQRLEHLAGGANHQGAAAVIAEIAYRDVNDLLNDVGATTDDVRATKPLLLILDRIVDPGNLGAILRTARAAGVAAVITSARRSAPLGPVAVKASAGTALDIPIARQDVTPEMVVSLKERGYWVVAASGDGETRYDQFDWNRPVALLLGSEEKGLSPELLAEADARVRIPLANDVESLNASVAAGVLLYAAVGARSASKQ